MALAVLCMGSVALAQPPAPPPPEPLSKPPESITPPPLLPPAPIPVLPQDALQTRQSFVSQPFDKPEAGKASHEALEGHDSHKEEEENSGAFIIDGEYLLMRPRRRSQDYAVVGSDPNGGPIGVIKSLEGGFDSGFRVGAGYRFPGENWEARFYYTFYHETGNDLVAAPPGGFVFPTLTFPAVVTRSNSAAASNSVNLNVFDVEFGKRWEATESMSVRWFVGPRFANIDQKFMATYTGGDVSQDNVRRRLFFDGGGARAGGELNCKVFDHLGFYACGSVSLMTGRFRSDLLEVANGQTIVNVSEKFDKVVPVMDLGVGISYQMGGLRLSAGYQFINWFGMVEGIDFSDDVSPGKYARRTGDLGFDGLVFRAEWLF
jgi:hypothetical protein